MIKKYTLNGRNGVWRTIGGRRVFIADGDSLSKAMKDSGKFNRKKMTRKEKEAEYELYKKARQDENSIDPMTENSTDWEALDRKYRDRYEDEFNPKVNVKNDKGQWETKRMNEVKAQAHKEFKENEDKIRGMVDRLGIAKKEYDENPSDFTEIAREHGLSGKDYEDFDNYAKSKNPLSSKSKEYDINDMSKEAVMARYNERKSSWNKAC